MASIPQAFALAIQHHQCGRLRAAERIYRQIVAAQPNHAHALHLLGVIAHQGGSHECAVEYIERAIRLQGGAAAFHNNLGEAHRALQRIPEAVACYRRALELKPDYAEAHSNLGNALMDQGRLDEAIACYRCALELKPDYAEAHYNLGVALKDQGRLDEAVACYRRALELKPDCAGAHFNLGNAFKQQGRLDEAVASYRRALELKPDYAVAHNNLGNALNEQGKLEEAVACYRLTVKLRPEHAEAHHNLGNAFKQLGKLDEALACCRRALELNPDYGEAHNNLGNIFKEQGRLDEAVACYRRALELRPDFADTHCNLGNVMREQGKLDEAAACCRRALELRPDHAETHYNLGNVMTEQGKPEQAVACYRRALELKPEYAEAQSNLGVAFKDQGKLDEALACYRRALELKPDFAEPHCNLGNAFKEQGKLDEAVACYCRALELKADFAEAHCSLGTAFMDQGKPDEALACYRRALELKPDYAEAHAKLGNVFEEIGDLQGAEDCFRAALRHNSRFAFAHYKLAELLRGRLPEKDVAAQRRLLAQRSASGEEKELPDEQRLLLHFGLAQVLDARGEYAEAAEHLERGNALQLSERRKRGREYDPKAYELLVERMIAACTPDFFARVRAFGLESDLPVFVVGLPRSGTTLVEQVLAGHSRVFAAGEIKLAGETMAALGGQGADSIEGLRRLDRETARCLASRHLERLRALNCRALRIVDKLPDNYLYLGLLAGLFPRAKFVHCRRDLRDVAVSCWMTHFGEICWANDHEHIASRFRGYQRIMAHWRKVLPAPVLDVDYEESVADLEGVARRLVAWCGLAWEPACLEFQRAKRPVRTASAVHVRQPLYGTSVARWRHYEQALGVLFARLESVQP